ncbi:MAG: MBL fold metallo-hydrolase [Candidatus Omnitrophica bacterium]|nr:MBL fold metallo-hydrolase [Candidatus Omnitrophota bacterium]
MPVFKRLIPQNPFGKRTYGTLHKVSKNVFIFRNIANSSFIIGRDAVAVIDTQVNRPLAENLLKAIRSVTDKPIRYVINTHYHWDHTNGNQIFADQGAVCIASDLTAEFMTVRKFRQKQFLASRGFELGFDPKLPDDTFTGQHEIDLGDCPVRIFFAGCAESDDASAVHVLNDNVLMAGDTVMTGSFPIFGQPCWDEGLEGTGQWIKTVQKLLLLNPKKIIPGHGPLAKPRDIDLFIRIQSYFTEEVKKRVDAGMPLNQILGEMEAGYPKWITRIPLVWGTPKYAALRIYRSLTQKRDGGEPGWQKYKPSVIPGADLKYEKGVFGTTVAEWVETAEEAFEGGDAAKGLSVLRCAKDYFPQDCTLLSCYADKLVEFSKNESSVLEKGDFFDEARKCWEQALSIDSNHVPSLIGKGRFLTMMAFRGGDDPGEGMELLEKANELSKSDKDQLQIQFYLGVGYRRLGNENKAKDFFVKASKIDAGWMPVRMALASS